MLEGIFKKYEMEYRPWSAIVANLEAIMIPEDLQEFQKLYRQFNSYKSEALLIKLYDFIYTQNIQYHVNCHRIPRLRIIWEALQPHLKREQALLDLGAGTGLLSEAIRETRGSDIHHVWDISPACRNHLLESGFELYSEYIKYDTVLLIDALGEINSDEDDEVVKALGRHEPYVGDLLEERYGFAQKLAGWKSSLAPGAKLYLCEPLSREGLFECLGAFLQRQGWQWEIFTAAEGRPLGLMLKFGGP